MAVAASQTTSFVRLSEIGDGEDIKGVSHDQHLQASRRLLLRSKRTLC